MSTSALSAQVAIVCVEVPGVGRVAANQLEHGRGLARHCFHVEMNRASSQMVNHRFNVPQIIEQQQPAGKASKVKAEEAYAAR